MGQIESLRDKVTEATKLFRELIDGIKEDVLKLPDNPKAHRIAPNIVIVNSKDLLSQNWTAEFYNFKWQYQAVALYISADNATPEQLLKRMESVLDEGKVPYPHHPIKSFELVKGAEVDRDNVIFDRKYKQALHPDVINNLRAIFQK